MKTLLIVRHAKSSWAEIGQPDIERPLNERGKKDAPDMAQRLLNRNIKIDLFVSSPAKRARKTAKLFAQQYQVNKEEIVTKEDLYEAETADFNSVVSSLDDKYKTIALFSHNPGITWYANTLVKGIKVDNMPTCSVFAVSAEIREWKDFETSEKKFLFFDYPKKSV
jgi:phosphohistidine phosphatase